jgi:Rrf2 family protein
MITREADYALRALIFLAGCDCTLTTLELSEKLDIPYPFLRRIVNTLDSAEILTASRGKKGGVVLRKNPSLISLFEVLSLFDMRGLTLNSCLYPDESKSSSQEKFCPRSPECPAHKVLSSLQNKMHDELRSINLNMLMKQDFSQV